MEEKKKRINKLMLPLTIKSLSVLGAVTIMATSAGCQSNKNNKKDNSKSSSITSSEGTDYVSGEARIESEIDQTVSSEVDSEGNVIITDPSTGETIIASSDGGKKPSSNNTNGNNGNNGNNGSTNSTKPSQTNPTNPSTQSPSSAVTSTPEFTPSVPNLPSTLTASNINDIEVINNIRNNIFTNRGANFTTISYWYNNKLYKCGAAEYNFTLLLLNSNYINNNTYESLFGDASIDDLKRYSNVVSSLMYSTGHADFSVNYDNIVIDQKRKQFLNNLQSAIHNKANGDLKQFVINFFKGNQQIFNYKDDVLIDYFVSCAGYQNLDLDDSEVDFYLMNNYFDIEDSMPEYIKEKIYQKYRGNQLEK